MILCMHIDKATADRIDFNYHQLDVGPRCTTVSWNYIRSECSPVKFNLQGFFEQDVRSHSYNTPRISVNSTSPDPVFKLPNVLLEGHNMDDNTLYFRVRGVDASDIICEAYTELYNFSPPDENGN